MELLPNGHLLISTSSTYVDDGGLRGGDEDILEFNPSSLGENTNGTWSLYFDGSDVDLGSNNEDMDGLAVAGNGDIYLSTIGSFSVIGVSGDDEDVFVCTPLSLGNTTACTYVSTLFFDGSFSGLDANDLNAFDLP